jgi:hypothetical protein
MDFCAAQQLAGGWMLLLAPFLPVLDLFNGNNGINKVGTMPRDKTDLPE